jgi:small conductance mechanosensitive channel
VLRVANKSQEWARAVLDIEVDGATDYERAAAIIQHVADEVSGDENWMAEVVATPEVWGIESFTADGYTIRLVIKTRPASQFGLMRELRIRLHAAFVEAGLLTPGERWAHEAGHDVGVASTSASKTATKRKTAKPALAGEAPHDDRPEHPKRGDPGEAG